ncbi:hypothetical protein acsn021_01680 [Anaerocolumna cellulosilytica]|uniref:Uncharacterized protein n=1 Tax=Anaerocolumna cellulosilytica TaxID=433286 RepID=A0A6S6QU32_9FIRM|nr:hypothetical protein [Anaerocolumna cellulosilytica]MBB5197928.1 hypothetical protein [Anaerocolumna cellulosilytica]BCJ92599.1 hypothetical protein acsn021_01680 [Anaerocolumna cellulosilytica]
MAEYTKNYNLKKQQDSDYISIEGLNNNFDVIDEELNKLEEAGVKAVDGKGLSSNDFTDAEKSKLAGVAVNANNYVHPANHSPTVIAQDANNRFVTDAEKAAWNGKQNALGYTPVRQGTGFGQYPNLVSIGWSGSRLKATVDSTDLGNIAFGDIPTTLPANGGNSDSVDGVHIQVQTSIPASLGNNVLCIVYE